MKYSDFKALVMDQNTGSSLPTTIDILTKLVLGKIARLKLTNRKKVHEITVSGNTEWVLGTEIPDFLSLKLDLENRNRCIYYFQSTEPQFLVMTNHTRFTQNTEGGYAEIVGGKLKINLPTGITVPDTLYVPYWSKYLVLDEDETTEKEKPTNADDTFLLDSIFEDALYEGVLLYVKRRELSDTEFFKAVQEWEKSTASLQFYQ